MSSVTDAVQPFYESEKNFFTPIGWAIEWRNLRALRLLVKAGFADVSAIETIEGWKPVDPLASLGDREKKKMQKFINDCKET